MNEIWSNKWDERYAEETFAYGEQPNEYLKVQLGKLTPGKILFAAEGEGRNAVYAAKKGWDVAAFDISAQGKKKAELLAERNNMHINYQIGLLPELEYASGQFDVIALIYAHFPSEIKSTYHQILGRYLRSGGTIIFEAFSKNHLEYLNRDARIGGPKELDMLFSVEELQADFPNFEIQELVEQEINLQEGNYHNGLGSVIRFTGTKK